MTGNQKAMDEFVDKFIYEYLSRDIEFSDVYEDEDAEDFSDDQLREVHGKIMVELKRIRNKLYTS